MLINKLLFKIFYDLQQFTTVSNNIHTVQESIETFTIFYCYYLFEVKKS